MMRTQEYCSNSPPGEPSLFGAYVRDENVEIYHIPSGQRIKILHHEWDLFMALVTDVENDTPRRVYAKLRSTK